MREETPSAAEFRRQAVNVLGSKELAMGWLRTPAMALNQQRPMDLLGTEVGRQTVSTLLVQLEFGVYL